MQSSIYLRIALGLIALIAVVWFVSSFFVLEGENPRSGIGGSTSTITRIV